MSNSKKRIKNEINYKLSLTEEQKKAKAEILKNKITILTGVAGSSKTFTSVQVALDEFFKKNVSKIVITRPTVSSEDIGFLPGSIEDKMSYWIVPIMHNMYNLYDKAKIDKHFQEGEIEILPLQFIGGITFVDSVVILDEAQNATHDQLERFLTRLGRGSRIIINGDENQIDLKKESLSGLSKLVDISNKIDKMTTISLKENHRDPIVEEILKEYNRK